MKVISKSEMEMFSEFAQPYFEYMCRSFNQTCPTALCKVLGAFKLKISNLKKREYFYVILMENLVLGMNPNSSFLTKYDLKGSMSRRYVDAKGKP
jgi:Phosphatidylinositol-4-phosphate 5-Kinase